MLDTEAIRPSVLIYCSIALRGDKLSAIRVMRWSASWNWIRLLARKSLVLSFGNVRNLPFFIIQAMRIGGVRPGANATAVAGPLQGLSASGSMPHHHHALPMRLDHSASQSFLFQKKFIWKHLWSLIGSLSEADVVLNRQNAKLSKNSSHFDPAIPSGQFTLNH